MILICEQYTMFSKLGRNWNVHNTFKTTQIYDNIFFPIFLCIWNLFKFWFLIWNFILFKYFIFWLNQLHVNHKSHVLQPTITPMSWKPWNSYMHVIIKNAWFTLKMHLHLTFSSNNYNLKANGLLNNTLFMFWNMNFKL
jgi:hypothetical protein